jgi:alpha-tubulin suppressor-like RCC1 family protein
LLSKEFDKLIEHTTSHDLKGSFKEESKTEVLEDTFAVVKMDSAQLFAWGSNRRGQICTGRDFSNDPIPVSFDAIKNLLFVACGHAHTIMVSELGQTFAMGDNSKCQLGLPPQTKAAVIPQRLENIVNPSQIACGAATSYVVAQGKLYSWGEAAYGALGSKQALQNTWKPIEVKIDKHIKHISAGDHHTAAITVDDQMYVWGANSFG